jgi:hypothetical protein
MKIRNHRKYEWLFHPHKKSKLEKHVYRFKYKADLMIFLIKHFEESLNGVVRRDHTSFNCSNTQREWFVWYAPRKEGLKIVLKQMEFRGRKFICKPYPISKEDKKYFAHSDKVVQLMCNIYEEDAETILPSKASKLIELFKKRGFKDFEPDDEEWEYINGHISNGISFYYWSDRCNFLRAKTIYEYFKREGLCK